MQWDAAQVVAWGRELQAMARLKYDEYEGYRPGQGFLEHLVAWLAQMCTTDREVAVAFVRHALIFITRAELDHAIETVYPDLVRPLLIAKAAERIGVPSWRTRYVTASPEFADLHRKTLVLGLGDGARIDRLRRTSRFSHEQFYIAPELSDASVKRMQKKLQEAVGGEDRVLFEHVFLVDDFAGSGYTSIRGEGGVWDGRLERTREHLERLAGKAVIEGPAVSVILYVASAQAERWISDHLDRQGLGWRLHVVQLIPEDCRVTDVALLEMCRRYFDEANYDVLGEHVKKKEGDIRHGFGDGRLPLVLSHNTPNNSISLLWADTTDRPESKHQAALFPRRHRHNAERP